LSVLVVELSRQLKAARLRKGGNPMAKKGKHSEKKEIKKERRDK
jgi:hypothetical protein